METENKVSHSPEIEETENRIADIIDDESATAVEALLFASPDPLDDKSIARIIGRKKQDIPEIIDRLNRDYAEWRRSFRIEKFGDKYRFYTLPDYDQYIARLAEIPKPVKLSRAALEVLSIIAYKQPVVKAEIERVRGINSDGVLKTLMERNLIESTGRSDGPGRPMLYKTTNEFLEFFGMSDLSQLPAPEIDDDSMEAVRKLEISRLPENPDPPAVDETQ